MNKEIDELKDNTSRNNMSFISYAEELKKPLSDVDTSDERTLGEGFYRLAKIYYDSANLKKAEELFVEALSRTVYPIDVFATLKIYGFLIRIYSESLRGDEAEKYINESDNLLERFSKDTGSLTAEYFYNAGVVKNYKGLFDEAIGQYAFAHKKAQTENEPDLMAKSLYALATTHYQKKNYDEALNYLGQLKELLRILKKDYLRGSMHMLYGNIYKDRAEYAKSLESFDLAMEILLQKNCWNLYSYILLGRGIVLKQMGEFSNSLIYFNLALKTSPIHTFKRLRNLIESQVEDVNDSSVDIYLDRHNRLIHEKDLGTVDFKHRFVLLEILFLLARNPGKHFNKDDLSKLIWKDEYNPLIHDKLIYTSISRLRKLIEPKSQAKKYIIRDKDGYTFNPRVNARFYKENDHSFDKFIGNVDISSPL